jgi:hypothetical protein
MNRSRARQFVKSWLALHFTYGWRPSLRSAVMLMRREMHRQPF